MNSSDMKPSAQSSPGMNIGAPRFLIPVFLFFSVCIIGLGWFFYSQREKSIKEDKQAELSAIADLKAEQIVRWREERLTDARVIISDPPVTSLYLEKYLRSVTEQTSQKTLSAWLTQLIELEHYRSAFLLDKTGKQLFGVPGGREMCKNPEIQTILDSAITHGCIVMSDLHKDGPDKNEIHSILIVPIVHAAEKNNGALGALALDIDPNQFLYPLIQSWPTPSRTAEVLLVRKEENDVVFLNELRYKKNSALNLRLPLNSAKLPAARAVSGDTGAMEGVDYRNVPVLAVARHIPGTPWFMVAKIDKNEAFAADRRLFRQVVFAITLLILLAGVLTALLQRHLSSRAYKRLYLAEKEKADLAESLAAEKERLRTLTDAAFEGICLSEKGIVLDANDQLARMFGYARGEVVGKLVQDFVAPADRKKVALAMQLGTPGASELHAVHKGGGIFPVEVRGRTLQAGGRNLRITAINDISERKKTEDALVAEKERLSVTLRSIGDAVIATDVSGRIVLMNKVAEALTGWPIAQAEGKQLSEVFVVVNEITRQPCENPVEKVLKSGSIVNLENHTVLVARDGRELVIADSGALIKDRESKTIGVVLVFRDNSEKQRAQEAMLKAEKLESLGVLAGGIAHDFNNLLSGLFGYLDLARGTVKKNDAAAQYIEKAFSVFGRAKDLTGQLLTFAKGGAPARKTQSLSPLIRDAVHFALSGSSIQSRFDIPQDLWPCDIDENQIGQVLDNIIINARDAMPMGGVVTVSAENVAAGASLPPTLVTADHVRITVRDQGTGISPEHLPRIFDPFFTTKQKGSGLGLATAYSIVKRHDGTIEAESELGKGAAFHVYLPASAKKPAADTGGPGAARYTGSGRVLVMDDEEFIRDVAAAMIEDMGYSVETAPRGQEAVAIFTEAKDAGRPFDLAILDLTIPGGMGGKETKEKLKRIAPGVKIIASSGYSEDPVMARPLDFGFDGSVRKPYDKAELSQAVAMVMLKKG
jgi:PAS domain S-box-containing protein